MCLSAVVPAVRRTGHQFTVSGPEEPSPKIEFVFSASPETIRREPLECDLLRSVANLQDLAVCARKDLDVFSLLRKGFQAATIGLNCSAGTKSRWPRSTARR